MAISDSIEKIYSSFRASDKILVALSGGADSTFLLYVLKNFSPAQVSALTVKTPYIPEWEIDEAKRFCISMNIDHEIINIPLHRSILYNPPDRCYRCKSLLFGHIKKYAEKKGFNIITDGSNADDLQDYRPGMKALRELDIRSPLLEAGFTKDQIRKHLVESGLEAWNKPANACLLTRIPYNVRITHEDLRLIEEAENFLHTMGFPGARVRLHKEMVRIEVLPAFFEKVLDNTVRNKIVRYFEDRGADHVTLDLQGYRMGSMNKEQEI